jgi:uncharacterized membrane protein YheB (UPF0754 family)
METEYAKTWNSMNELEQTVSKVLSAKEILDSAIMALEDHKYDKVERLLYATYEFLDYYIEDFDNKFKSAWEETVVKKHKEQKVSPHPQFSEKDADEIYSSLKNEEVLQEHLDKTFDEAQKFYRNATSYQEAIESGWSMTDDGFWMPPQKQIED